MDRYPLKSVLLIFTLLMLTLFLAGCPYESEVPLTTASEASGDPALIGSWKFWDKDGRQVGTAVISAFNGQELLIDLYDEESKTHALFRAFVSPVGKEKFLNMQEIKGSYDSRRWMLVNYRRSECTLTCRIVEERLFKSVRKELTTSSGLRTFVERNLGNKDLYDAGEPTILTCMNREIRH